MIFFRKKPEIIFAYHPQRQLSDHDRLEAMGRELLTLLKRLKLVNPPLLLKEAIASLKKELTEITFIDGYNNIRRNIKTSTGTARSIIQLHANFGKCQPSSKTPCRDIGDFFALLSDANKLAVRYLEECRNAQKPEHC